LHFLKKISNSSSTDSELVLAYQQHHELDTLALLYQRYMELVYGVCLKYLPDEEAAKDAVMHIFEELIGKLKHHQVENFRGWLHVLAKNHCLMILRSPRYLKTSTLNEGLVQFDENVHLNGVMEKEEQLDQMSECLKGLVHEQQRCVELFYLQNKSYNEIVNITGFDWKSVRSYIQNGRRNLKICMENRENAEAIRNKPAPTQLTEAGAQERNKDQEAKDKTKEEKV
jgi:RNA polymerase sigma factor (sigma-70 family)